MKNSRAKLEADKVILPGKLEAIEAAFTEYYDSATEEQLIEERDWAAMAGPNAFTGLNLDRVTEEG